MSFERTCCVCRKKADKAELFRFVFAELDVAQGPKSLRLDFEQKNVGRGAYVHTSPACMWHRGALAFVVSSLNRKSARRASRKEAAREGELASVNFDMRGVVDAALVSISGIKTAFALESKKRLESLSAELLAPRKSSKQIRL